MIGVEAESAVLLGEAEFPVPAVPLPYAGEALCESLHPVVFNPGHVPDNEVDVVGFGDRLVPPLVRSEAIKSAPKVRHVLVEGGVDYVSEVYDSLPG